MRCVLDETYINSSSVLSRAGHHQKYATNLLSSIYFCRFTYPTQDGFAGPEFLQLGDDLILAAAQSGGFHLIRNGLRKLKAYNYSDCYKFSCSQCLPYRGDLNSRQVTVYRKNHTLTTKRILEVFLAEQNLELLTRAVLQPNLVVISSSLLPSVTEPIILLMVLEIRFILRMLN